MPQHSNRASRPEGAAEPRRALKTLLAALFLFAGSLAAANDAAPALNQALAPLRAMPVQEGGFIRSAFTFGHNHLSDITGRSTLNGMSPLAAALWLISNPDQTKSLPLIKIDLPDLVKLFNGKKVSLEQMTDPIALQQLNIIYQRNPKLMNRPLGELEQRYQRLQNLEHDFAIVPRAGTWLSPMEAARAPQEFDAPILAAWDGLKVAIAANDHATAAENSQRLAQAVNASAQQQGLQLPQLNADVFYHRHQPFAKSAFFYLLAALGFGATLLLNNKWPARLGFAMLAVGLAEQALGVYLRWNLGGRAPLSNMYESFTFAVAGMVLAAAVFEVIYKNKIAGLGGGILGFIFMVMAHKLPIFDSKINPIMPALQSSWLTYHVVVIMLSYSAFALSFFIALVFLAKDFLGGDASQLTLLRRLPTLRALDVFNYRVIAVGFPLLTLGIIFGAVWADTAWGRPWGFDPKETWSAITWLIYAIYLHARYLAGWKGRRAAALAICGFAAVLFTYVGVNFLLSGLHSYA